MSGVRCQVSGEKGSSLKLESSFVVLRVFFVVLCVIAIEKLQGVRREFSSVRYQVSGEKGARHEAQGARGQVSGCWLLVEGLRCQVSGGACENFCVNG